MIINTHENIQVQLVDYNLKIISNFNQNFRNIYDHIIDKSYENPRFPFVSTVDPYSYTMYNSIQTPLLINELQQLINEDDDVDFINATGEFIDYLKKVKVHEFIRFLGD